MVANGIQYRTYSHGKYDKPFEMRSSGTVYFGQQLDLQRLKANYGEISVQLKDPAEIIWKDDGYSVNNLELEIESGSITVSGDIRQSELNASVLFEQIPLELLHLAGIRQQIDGKASGTVTARGSMAQPEIEADVKVQQFTADILSLSDTESATVSLKTLLQPGLVIADVNLKGLSETWATAHASVPVIYSFSPFTFQLGDQGDLRASIDAQANLKEFNSNYYPAIALVSGKFVLNASAGGTIRSPEITGHATLNDGSYFIRNQTIPLLFETDFSIKDETAHVTKFNLQSAGSVISAQASLPIGSVQAPSRKGKLNGLISIDADLEQLSALVLPPSHILEGSLAGSFPIGGHIDALDLQGKMEITDGMYENITSGIMLKNLRATITPKDSRIAIEHLSATGTQGGTITGHGWIQIKPKEHFPIEVNVSLNEAQILQTAMVRATFGGDLRAAGDLEQLLIAGTLKPGPVLLHLDDASEQKVFKLKIIEKNKPGVLKEEKTKTTSPEDALSLKLDLLMEMPKQIYVQGYGLVSEWTGDIGVTGTLADPVIGGSLTVLRGHINIFNKRFTIKEGTITFVGGTPPTPVIDLIATTSAKEITAIIALVGPISSPELSISSSPELGSDEILSRVLFNRNVSSISPLQALRLAHAINQLRTGGNGFSVLESIQKVIGLDQVDFEQEEGAGSALSAGKYVGKDVYLHVKKKLSEPGGGVWVEKQVTPNISIDADVDDAQGPGVGVNWKWEY